MPKISVIIPTYNRAGYLNECLASVFNQSYKDFEVIMVDDGSTEDTGGMILKNYPGRVIYLRHELNLGKGKIFPALFTGLNASNSEYILLLGDDDLLEKGHMETAMRIFKSMPDAGCFSADMIQIDADGNVRSGESHFTAYLRERERGFKLTDKVVTIEDVFMYGLGTASSGAMFKKEMINEIGFYREEYGVAADWEYALRVAASRFKLYFCSMPSVRYRSHSTNISKDYYGAAKLKLMILTHALQDYPQLKKNLGYIKIKRRMFGLIKEFAACSFKAGRYKEPAIIIAKTLLKMHLLFMGRGYNEKIV